MRGYHFEPLLFGCELPPPVKHLLYIWRYPKLFGLIISAGSCQKPVKLVLVLITFFWKRKVRQSKVK